jgi:hypothetical protein
MEEQHRQLGPSNHFWTVYQRENRENAISSLNCLWMDKLSFRVHPWTCQVLEVICGYNSIILSLHFHPIDFFEFQLQVVGVSDFDENPPVENGIYLSNGTRVLVYSKFNNGDWFDCMWASTTCPAPLTTTSDSSISTTSTLSGMTPSTTTSKTTY